MNARDGGHCDDGIDALAAREYEQAADFYTRGARSILADPRPDLSPFEADEKGWVGAALESLVVATVAYRVADADSRATGRAVEGVAVTRDLKHGLAHPVQHACLDEFVADFRAAAELEGVAEAYESAVEAYESAADAVETPQARATTPLFEAAATPITQLARGQSDGEIAITWEDLHGSDPSDAGAFLSHRPAYKRQRFPGLVNRAVADSHLAAPRGTTAYGTDTYRCPECGADDVNWTGNNVLCLRCSTPVERKQ
ncbi:MAG: hypothetical protein ABEH61_00925 [Haloarculaceae archaeon]